jgi:hypothetical protein
VVHAITNSDPNTSRLAEAGSTRAECSGIGTGQHVSRILEELSAGIGQFDTTFRAPEQSGLEFPLKSLNLVRERGLRDVQLRRGVTKMERLCDGNKTTDLLQFHAKVLINRTALLIRTPNCIGRSAASHTIVGALLG